MAHVSFITTVRNEEKTILPFLDSLSYQSILPDELIVVDGGSSDSTISQIKLRVSDLKKKGILTKVVVKKGNRSVGRNEAIIQATGDIILCSDAGNILDKNWIKNMLEPFADTHVDVVSGYYRGKPENIFQKCLLPYVLVMPDKVDPQSFLPAARSMAFKKSIWEKVGGFDEKLSHNEDYEFAQRLKKMNVHSVFVQEAIVYWIPRNTFTEAFVMFRRFAYGDIEAGIVRGKVVLLFLRYIIVFLLCSIAIFFESYQILLVCIPLLLLYIGWAINKNYRYVRDLRAIFFLPMLQFTADIAVITGSLQALLCKDRN